MKITAVAKGDCAQNSTTIVVTDTTAACSIEISITPAKKYRDVILLVPRTKTSYSTPWFMADLGRVAVSAKGRATVTVPKAKLVSGGLQCVITEGSERIVAQVTNSTDGGRSYSAAARSAPITVTYRQTQPTEACYSQIPSR
jgi:hypothetical protein